MINLTDVNVILPIVLLHKWYEADISCPEFYSLSLDNLFNNIILHFINNI